MNRSRSKGTVTMPDLDVHSDTTLFLRGYWPDVDRTSILVADSALPVLRDDRCFIADVVGAPGQFNGTTHTKLYPFTLPRVEAGVADNFDGWQSGDDSSRNLAQNNRFNGGEFSPWGYYPELAVMPIPGGEFLPAIPWNEMIATAGDEISGGMAASTSMLTNFVQLSQTVRMFKNPLSVLSLDWRKMARRKSASALLKAGSNVWLEKRYGWDNFFRDVADCCDALTEVRDHIAFLNRTKGTYASIGQRHLDVVPISSSLATIQIGPLRLEPQLTTIRQSACFSMDYKRAEQACAISAWALYLQRIGMGSMLECMWDVLPYSFVVDWFINVSQLLKHTPNYWNPWSMRNVGYSVKVSVDCQVKMTMTSSNSFRSYDQVRMIGPQCVFVKYDRANGFPVSTDTLGFFSGMTLTHLADAGSLLAQRLP